MLALQLYATETEDSLNTKQTVTTEPLWPSCLFIYLLAISMITKSHVSRVSR